METKPDGKKYDKRSSVARRHPGDKKRDSFGKFLASYSFITGGRGRNVMFLQVGSCGTLVGAEGWQLLIAQQYLHLYYIFH